MLHCMTIRLIHEHQVETVYLYYGVKGQPRIIWGQKVKSWFSLQMFTLLCYIACYSQTCIRWGPSNPFMTFKVISGFESCRCRREARSFVALVSYFFPVTLFQTFPDIRFWPNLACLVIFTSTLTTTHVQTMMGSKVMVLTCDFHRKCYFSCMLHDMLRSQRSTWGHLRSLRSFLPNLL